MLRKARRTTDPRKLAGMLPAWLKASLSYPPKPFVYVAEKLPKFPPLPSGADWHTKTSSDCMPDPFRACRDAEKTLDYVQRYNKARGLRPG